MEKLTVVGKCIYSQSENITINYVITESGQIQYKIIISIRTDIRDYNRRTYKYRKTCSITRCYRLHPYIIVDIYKINHNLIF